MAFSDIIQKLAEARRTIPDRVMQPIDKSSLMARSPIQHAFITGFPGFIARHLAKTLLSQRSRSRITVLVEKSMLAAAQDLVGQWSESMQSRTEILIGDITKIDLGLSGPEVKRLTASVSHIFHLAGIKAEGLDAQAYERVNVKGTQHTLEFAKDFNKLKRFVHFSSAFVSGDRHGVVTESELDCGQKFRNDYERSKFRAEALVQQQFDRLPITIVRPSIVVGLGEKLPGITDPIDGLYAMTLLMVASPISIPIPLGDEADGPFHIVPVDFVISAALHLATLEAATSQVFHLVDPNPLSARHVYQRIAKRIGKNVSMLPLGKSTWVSQALKIPFLKKRLGTEHMSSVQFNHLTIYNCSHTLQALHGTNVQCPPIDTYLDELIQFIRRDLRDRARQINIAGHTNAYDVGLRDTRRPQDI